MLRLISSLGKNNQKGLLLPKGSYVQNITALFSSKKENQEEAPVEEVTEQGEEKVEKVGKSEKRERKDQTAEGEEFQERKPRRFSSRDSNSQPQQYQKILRTSQDQGELHEPVSFGVNSGESTEYFNSQLKTLDTHMPLNVFSCLNLTEQQEKAMKYLLQDDEQRNIRTKIGNQFKKIGETGITEEIVTVVHSLVQTAVFKEQTFIISERDFKALIFSPEFLRVVPLFFNRKFFSGNQSFLTQLDIVQIFKKCKTSSQFYPLMELLKYYRSFYGRNNQQPQRLSSPDKDLIQQLLYDIRNDTNSKLNFLLTFFIANNQASINLANMLEAGDISKHFARVHIGTLDEKSKAEFSGRLHELLNIKLKLGLSTSLQHYLCDTFFGFDSYDQGLTSIAFHILIFARLAEGKSNISDLLTQYTSTFGQHKFDFYLSQSLPGVLQSLQNKTFFTNYTEGLKLYKSSQTTSGNSNNNTNSSNSSNSSNYSTKVEYQKLTYFDHAFAQKGGVIVYNYDLTNVIEPIQYKYNSSNILINEKQNQYSTKFSQYQDAYINNTKQVIVENLLKESTLNPQIAQETKAKLKELAPLLASNPTEYYNQMFTFIYTALDEEFENEKPSMRQYFKNRNIHTPIVPVSTSFTSANRFGFSSTKKEIEDLEDDTQTQQAEVNPHSSAEQSEIKSQKAFSQFMAKVREIDKVAEKSNPFVTKDDIQKMKDLQKSEGLAHQKDAQTIQLVAGKKPVEKAITHSKPASNQFFQELFASLTNVDEGVLRLEKELFDKRSNFQSVTNGLASLPANFIEGFPEGKYLLYKAFSSPSLYEKDPHFKNLMNEVDLTDKRTVLNAKTLRLGELSRDYSQYLQETVVGQGLEAPAYNSLIEVCGTHYKRRILKKILTHILVFRPQLEKSTIEAIINICRDNKLGITLFEFTYLLANDGKSHLPQPLFIQLLNSLKGFDEVHEDIETLVRVYLSSNINRKFENKIIESYINSLIKTKNMNKLMSMLERLRDFFLLRKLSYNENITSEKNNELSEKYKQEQRDIIQSMFRMYIQKLNSNGLNQFAKPLFQELTNMKYALNEQDYIQGFISMQDRYEDMNQLYDQMLDQKAELTIETIQCLLEIFKKHPKTLAQLTIRILKEQIYSEKVNLEVNDINEFAVLFTKNDIPQEYSDLLRYLLKFPHKVNEFTKQNSYRVVNNITEEMIKQFMKGQVEELFSSQKQEQMRQKLLEERTRKRLSNQNQGSRPTSPSSEGTTTTTTKTTTKTTTIISTSTAASNPDATKQAESATAATSTPPQTKSKKKEGKNEKGAKQAETETSAESKPNQETKVKAESAKAATVAPVIVKVKQQFHLRGGRELEYETQEIEGQSERLEEELIGKMKNKKLMGKEGKRKVLRKTGVSKFKDIENYIKEIHTTRHDAKK